MQGDPCYQQTSGRRIRSVILGIFVQEEARSRKAFVVAVRKQKIGGVLTEKAARCRTLVTAGRCSWHAHFAAPLSRAYCDSLSTDLWSCTYTSGIEVKPELVKESNKVLSGPSEPISVALTNRSLPQLSAL